MAEHVDRVRVYGEGAELFRQDAIQALVAMSRGEKAELHKLSELLMESKPADSDYVGLRGDGGKAFKYFHDGKEYFIYDRNKTFKWDQSNNYIIEVDKSSGTPVEKPSQVMMVNGEPKVAPISGGAG